MPTSEEIINEFPLSQSAEQKIQSDRQEIMFESFIKEGNQKIDPVGQLDMDGLSVVDPCLSWDQTELLLYDLAELV